MKIKIVSISALSTVIVFVLYFCFIHGKYLIRIYDPFGGHAKYYLYPIDIRDKPVVDALVSTNVGGDIEVMELVVNLSGRLSLHESRARDGIAEFRVVPGEYLVIRYGNSYTWIKEIGVSVTQEFHLKRQDLHVYGLSPEVELFLQSTDPPTNHNKTDTF